MVSQEHPTTQFELVEHRLDPSHIKELGMGTSTCPICASTAGGRITVKEQRFAIGHPFEYVVCAHCRLVRLADPPESMDSYYSAGYSYYRKTNKQPSALDQLYGRIVRALLRPLDRFYPEDSTLSVLDVGAARGAYLAHLHQRGFRQLKGLEPSAEAVKNAVNPDIDLVHSRFEDFIAEQTWEVITLNQVFEHLPDPHTALLKLKHMLRQNGVLVMSFPNYDSLARAIFGRYWPGYDAPRHYFTFNPGCLRSLCDQCGMTLKHVRYISKPSQFLGPLQYLWNDLTGSKQMLEDGFFRNNKLMDLSLFPLSYTLNALGWGDMIEVYIVHREKKLDSGLRDEKPRHSWGH